MRSVLLILAFLLLVVGVYVFRGAVGGSDRGLENIERNLHRERVVAAASIENWPGALEAIQPLVDRDDPEPEDLIRAGSLHLEESQLDEARALFERAGAIRADDPYVLWGLYRIASELGEFERALPLVEQVQARFPEDFPTKLALANTLADLDRDDEALGLYEELMDAGLDFGGSWYVSAVYRYSSLLRRLDRQDEADARLEEFQRLGEQGITVPDAKDMRRGSYGQVVAPAPGELEVDPATRLALLGDGGAPTTFTAESPFEVEGGVRGLTTVRVADEGLDTLALAREHAIRPAALDVLVWGESGLALLRRTDTGFERTTITTSPTTHAAVLNVDPFDPVKKGHVRDGLTDVVARTANGLELFVASGEGDGTTWAPFGTLLLPANFEVSDITPLDFDHEGDVDLLVVGPTGVRLLRNDGVPADGATFTDVTAEAGLPRDRGFNWCAIEDVDVDFDVDLLLGGPDGAFYAKNERGGQFSDGSSALPSGLATEPALLDVTRDMRPDLIVLTPTGARVFENRIEDRFETLGEASPPWIRCTG